MTDTTTNKPLHVIKHEIGAHMWVPMSQLEDVKRLLESHQVSFWLDQFYISLNGRPAEIVVNFGRQVDAEAVQKLLDSVP